MGFQGFVVSDWAAIDQLPGDYKSDIETSINAGLDMIMIPNGPGRKNNYVEFIQFLRELVDEGRVAPARIDDAVRRILRVKYEMGAFEPKPVDPALTAAIGSAAHRQVARECVRQSLVLLKNDRAALPLSKDLKRLCVVGEAADDLGLQCGGWTIAWQGKSGNVTPGGTTLLQAIRQTVSSNTVVSFSADGSDLEGADAIIVAVAEPPYAEGDGDRTDLRLSPEAGILIRKARLAQAPVVTVLFSGRPLILGEALADSDAFVAAWLPGTEGQGMADVLFGDFKPTGKLPRPWPRAIEGGGGGDALFPFGHGLTYDNRSPRASARPATTTNE